MWINIKTCQSDSDEIAPGFCVLSVYMFNTVYEMIIRSRCAIMTVNMTGSKIICHRSPTNDGSKFNSISLEVRVLWSYENSSRWLIYLWMLEAQCGRWTQTRERDRVSCLCDLLFIILKTCFTHKHTDSNTNCFQMHCKHTNNIYAFINHSATHISSVRMLPCSAVPDSILKAAFEWVSQSNQREIPVFPNDLRPWSALAGSTVAIISYII